MFEGVVRFSLHLILQFASQVVIIYSLIQYTIRRRTGRPARSSTWGRQNPSLLTSGQSCENFPHNGAAARFFRVFCAYALYKYRTSRGIGR